MIYKKYDKEPGHHAIKRLEGKKFGRLTVLYRTKNNKGHKAQWICQCDCGNTKLSKVVSSVLVSGGTKSCGCLMKEINSKKAPHGYTRNSNLKKRGYNTWTGMNNRCTNKNDSRYIRYGGRGITVCERWKKSFNNFMQDVGPRPSLKHSLDRINNNGNYEPGNVRWATAEEQRNNCSPIRKKMWISK